MRAYAKVFWERYTEINDHEKVGMRHDVHAVQPSARYVACAASLLFLAGCPAGLLTVLPACIACLLLSCPAVHQEH